MRRTVFQTVIIVFCIWHIFAVGIFTLPRAAKDSVSTGMRSLFMPVVSPYMFTTSQWQLWDMFAPNPYRNIIFYSIEEQTDDGWKEVMTIKPGTYPWWQHAIRFKYLINVMGESKDPTRAVQTQFLRTQCKALHLPAGTIIRLVLLKSYVPVPPAAGSMSFWNEWSPQFSRSIQSQVFCTSPA